MAKFCGFCGKALQPNAKFCTGCGKPVETTNQEPEQVVFNPEIIMQEPEQAVIAQEPEIQEREQVTVTEEPAVKKVETVEQVEEPMVSQAETTTITEEPVVKKQEPIAPIEESTAVEQPKANVFIPTMTSVSSGDTVTGKAEAQVTQKEIEYITTPAAQQVVQQAAKPSDQPTTQQISQPTEQILGQQTGNPSVQSPTPITEQTPSFQAQGTNSNHNALNVQQPAYGAASASVTPPKKNNTGLIIGIVAAILILCIGGIVFAVLNFFNTQSNQVFNADIAMSSPMGGNVSTYSPDDKSFIVTGTIDGINEDTPINLLWWDETIDAGMLDSEATVYANADGSFYYELNCEEIDYHNKGMTYPGDYSVTVNIPEEDFFERVEFSVYSNATGRQIYSDVFNDFYMYEEISENERNVVEAFPAGTHKIHAQMSYVNASTDMMVSDKWYRMEEGTWNQIIFDEQQIFPLTEEDGSSDTHNVWINSEKGWEAGQYKVELYLNETELAAVKEFVVGETTATTDVTPTATPDGSENTVKQEANITDIYMSDDLEGMLGLSSFPANAEVVYCQIQAKGIIDETEFFITWEDWATGDILVSMMVKPKSNGAHVFEYYPSDFGMDKFPLGTYQIGIYDAYYEEKLLASVAFDMVDPNGGEGELVDGDDGFVDIALVDLTQDEWLELNNWLNMFTDSRLSATGNTWDYTDQELIDFAVVYCVLAQDEEILNTLDDGGYYWIDRTIVDELIGYYFDITPIESPQSTELVVFDSATGRYGIYGEPIEEWPLNFPRVAEVYDLGDSLYEVVFDVYSVSIWFDGDPNGDPDKWQSANEMPEYLGTMDAIYEVINDEKILLSYEWY